MSDETEDEADWLASQFNPTAQVPPPPASVPVASPPADASAPPSSANGGFNWGLRPGGVVDPPSPVPPTLAMPPVTPQAAPPAAAGPTQPLTWDDFAATQQQSAPPPAVSPLDQPTEAYTVLPWQPAASISPVISAEQSVDAAEPTSALDALFGEHKFQDYEEVGVLKAVQTLPPTVAEPEVREPRAPLPTTQKALMGVAGGLIGVLILIGFFFLGQHLGSAEAAVPTPVKTHGATAVPTPAGTGGPAAPGVEQWTALQGGECIQSFSSAWAQTFTVVACTNDHTAEMVFKGKLPDSSEAPYPTAADFKAQLTSLCSAPTAINYAAASAVTDLQVSFSYPPNTAAWLSGDRTYYCFVNRTSGSNLTGDLALPKASGAS